MIYKKICIILGIIFIVLFIAGYGLKINKIVQDKKNQEIKDKELTETIETKLNFSQSEKESIDYDKLVQDIKKCTNRERNNLGGKGYIVKNVPAIDAYITEFYIDGELIYKVVNDAGIHMVPIDNSYTVIQAINIIGKVILILIAILEIAFLIIYLAEKAKK